MNQVNLKSSGGYLRINQSYIYTILNPLSLEHFEPPEHLGPLETNTIPHPLSSGMQNIPIRVFFISSFNFEYFS